MTDEVAIRYLFQNLDSVNFKLNEDTTCDLVSKMPMYKLRVLVNI